MKEKINRSKYIKFINNLNISNLYYLNIFYITIKVYEEHTCIGNNLLLSIIKLIILHNLYYKKY